MQPPRLRSTVRQQRLRLAQIAGPGTLANAFTIDNLVDVPDAFAKHQCNGVPAIDLNQLRGTPCAAISPVGDCGLLRDGVVLCIVPVGTQTTLMSEPA
jgi:hypothetical protein